MYECPYYLWYNNSYKNNKSSEDPSLQGCYIMSTGDRCQHFKGSYCLNLQGEAVQEELLTSQHSIIPKKMDSSITSLQET